MAQQTADPAIIKLKNVRLSFPHLFTAHSMEEGKEPQFSATFLLDSVKDAAVIKQIETTIDRVALDFFKKKVPLKKRGLRDGNEKPELEGYGDGVMFITATCRTRPPVVNLDLSPIAEADGIIYPGCFVNATIRLFAWEHKTGGRGVSAGLRAVQFYKDGDSFGAGQVNVEDEFDRIEPESISVDDL